VRRQRAVQRQEHPLAQRGLLRVGAAVADAQHHVHERVVGVAVHDQAVVHTQCPGAGACQRKQAAVADGGALHRAHQRTGIQGKVA